MSKDVPERAERSSGPAVPESVSVAVAELAEDLREGLLALRGARSRAWVADQR